jgi:hypothetical protein
MSLLLIILIVLLVLGVFGGGYSYPAYRYPTWGIGGVILLILVVLLLTGQIHVR